MAMGRPTEGVAAQFNRRCAAVGLIFLLISVGCNALWYAHKGVEQASDFPQYYMGGKIALAGAWDALYPQPIPSSQVNVGMLEGSTLRPRYAELATQAGVSTIGPRYIQPPPFALLLVPLALLPYQTSYAVWMALLTFGAWGIGLQAARIYVLSRGRNDRLAGIITLLLCFSPQTHRWVRSANVSVLVGWLIGYASLELIRRDSVRGGIALLAGALAKYAAIMLIPLFLLRGRYRALAWAAGLGCALLLISLPIMGSGPYRIFFHEIAPTLKRPILYSENEALFAFLLRVSGTTDARALPRSLQTLFHGLQIVSLVAILGTFFVRRREIREQSRYTFAAALALVSWLLVFSPIFWEHYHAYLGPFWGWLAAEAMRSRARLIGAVSAIFMAYIPWSIIARKMHFRQLPEPLYSHLLWATVLMGSMATWAILSARINIAQNA